MGLVSDVRSMHNRYPSDWLTAWSRVMTIRSVRVQRYLAMSPEQRRTEYTWLYKERGRKRVSGDETAL
jgi:hypothetical protein